MPQMPAHAFVLPQAVSRRARTGRERYCSGKGYGNERQQEHEEGGGARGRAVQVAGYTGPAGGQMWRQLQRRQDGHTPMTLKRQSGIWRCPWIRSGLRRESSRQKGPVFLRREPVGGSRVSEIVPPLL
eukprot:3281786-Rhodomonas_salina.3